MDVEAGKRDVVEGKYGSMISKNFSTWNEGPTESPFQIEDLTIFDERALRRILSGAFGVTIDHLAQSMQGVSSSVVWHLERHMSLEQVIRFRQMFHRPLTEDAIARMRQQVLRKLFWELTYWKTPELYEELTEGELLHPGIFQSLEPDIRGKTVLDVGAGSGRASLECLRHGAAWVYALEPSPGLRRILEHKYQQSPWASSMTICAGYFDALPLEENSIDLALSCSAFTALPEQGGEAGLVELRRVTRPGGKVVVIWPRIQDRSWLRSHGFQYVALPMPQEMSIHFSSLQAALRCAHRFYAQSQAVAHFLLSRQEQEIPFSVVGINPPCDYCWLEAKK